MDTAVLGRQTKLTSSKYDGRWRIATKRNESNLIFSLWPTQSRLIGFLSNQLRLQKFCRKFIILLDAFLKICIFVLFLCP